MELLGVSEGVGGVAEGVHKCGSGCVEGIVVGEISQYMAEQILL